MFNAFVFAQVFNEFNARSIFDEWNVLKGLHKNPIFMAIIVITIGLQVGGSDDTWARTWEVQFVYEVCHPRFIWVAQTSGLLIAQCNLLLSSSGLHRIIATRGPHAQSQVPDTVIGRLWVLALGMYHKHGSTTFAIDTSSIISQAVLSLQGHHHGCNAVLLLAVPTVSPCTSVVCADVQTCRTIQHCSYQAL